MANQSLFFIAKASSFVEDWVAGAPVSYTDFMLAAKIARKKAVDEAEGVEYPADFEYQRVIVEVAPDGYIRIVGKTHFEYKECHVIIL